MGPKKNTLLLLLLLSHWSVGFKTSVCDHQKTVETIKNLVGCFQEFQTDILKTMSLREDYKSVDAETANELIQKMAEAQRKCMAVLSVCVPTDQQEMLMTNPTAVVTTDNNCKLEDYMMVGQKVMTCAKEHGYEDSEKTVTEELCNKIKTGTQKCFLELKVDFSLIEKMRL